MALWLYANDNTTAPGGMVSDGGTLTNGSVGDTSTGPTEAGDSDSFNGGACSAPPLEALAYQQAVWDGLLPHTVTAISVTGKARLDGDEPFTACISPTPTTENEFISLLQYSLDGLAWTTLRTDNPTGGAFVTYAWSGSITARYIRRTLSARQSLTLQSTPNGSIYAFAQNTDLRVTASAIIGDCGLPEAAATLPRGTRRTFTPTGSTAPTTDEWEIYRCIDNVLTLIDSGMLGDMGVDGWQIDPNTSTTFDIYAPPQAIIADDYEARIDESASFYSINFNVTETEQTTMAERPFVFEQTRYGKESTAGSPVQAGRKSQMLGLAPPNPMEPSTAVTTPGNRNPTELIAQKGHTEAALTGPMGYPDLVEMLASLFGSPVIKTPVGATNTRDYIFHPPVARDENYHTFTFETGTEDFPARFSFASLVSATLNLGKTENMIEAQVIGQRITESLNAFTTASPGQVPLVPVAPKDNAYYVGTIYGAGLGTVEQLCETQNMSLTIGQRRVPHFTQCDGEDTFDTMIPTAEELLASLSLSHKSPSRGYLTNLRDKTQLFFKGLNTGPVIEGALRYEVDIQFPFKFQGTTRGESDSVTAGIHEMKPNYHSTFDPNGVGTIGGYLSIRVRASVNDVSFANGTPV